MIGTRALLASALYALLECGDAVSLPRTAGPGPGETVPNAFDGKYITSPPPGISNQAVEWWWFSAMRDEVNGIIPSVEAIFYEGFTFTRGPSDPPYRFDVSGVFPNGSTFFISTPVSAADVQTAGVGEALVGAWGAAGEPGAGFIMTQNRERVVISFNNSANGLTGAIELINSGTPAHGPCGGTDVPPYFGSLASGKNLNAHEAVLYEQTGWAISMPRAVAVVNIDVHGSKLLLNGTVDNVIGYHDHNWSPQALNQFAYTWLTGQGSCGPFDLSYLEVQALGSSHANDILQGFVAHNGEILQNQCSTFGEGRTKDTLTIELTGQAVDSTTHQTIPTGLKLDYTLKNGTHYVFTLKNSIENPAQNNYHRWTLGGSGGQVGGQQFDCLLVGDWVNPGLATYTEGKSIFDEQA
ncbi:hypothetical protein BGZ63DRAFT_425202 [Mariannaea sp. PMI_226]|nr:hypothetical protein BGZ63DRAFT_425202 [Mariannaea sp. PMI_226]